METTMTKIKDLATVTGDTLFCRFPIDGERYELLNYVEILSQGGHFLLDLWDTALISDRDVKMFLAFYDGTFHEAARCYVRSRLMPDFELTCRETDLAVRVYASFKSALPRMSRKRPLEDNVTIVALALWEAVVRYCDHIDGYRRVSLKDRRLTT
jgi:hypothetical protein